jgi:flavin reductase (DIM6/NTAB) family NADH-FMN oxidoreductase RutF
MATAALDSARLRRVFGSFPTGVTAVAALAGGEPAGLTANSFTSVSLDPPLASVCIAHSSATWPALRAAPRLGVSILSDAQEQAGRQLAGQQADRFAGLDWHATPSGAVLLSGASGWLEVSVAQQVRAGDHDIVVLRVHDLGADHALRPLVFHGRQFRKLALLPLR